MALTSLCLVLSTLTVSPERSQFFKYERISLRCANSSWTVTRTTSHQNAQKCQFGWAIPKGDSCLIETAYDSDTGVYWCESPQRHCSNPVNITVTAQTVILEIPPYPVYERDVVTLRCSYKTEKDFWSTSDFFASFYKDDEFIGSGDAGKMTLNVTKSHQGLYKCRHSSKGESPQSWLIVKDNLQPMVATPTPTPTPPPPLIPWVRLISASGLFLLYSIVLILCVSTYRKWARARAGARKR